MVQAIYTNRKGIYKDLYREIDSNNKKKESSQVKRPPKGIYRNLYKHIEGFKGKEDKQRSPLYFGFLPAIQKSFSFAFSRASSIFSSARSEIKMLIVACLIAKKPVSKYVEGYQDGR